jgi:hypothetical protein
MTDEYDRDELEDLKLAIGLLAGFSKRIEDGLPTWQYFKGECEIEPRRALARLLRNQKPLDSLVRCLLAALFDPGPKEPRYASFFGPVDRQLVFTKPGGREDAKTAMIVFEIMQCLERDTRKDHRGDQGIETKRPIRIGEAIAGVAQKFNIGERGVEEMWRRYRPKLRKRLQKAIKARRTVKPKRTF